MATLFAIGLPIAVIMSGVLLAEGVLWLFERPLRRIEHRDNQPN